MPYNNFVGLQLLTAPTSAPVTVADAKAHSRVFHDADDSLIAGYLWTAMLHCEDRTKRAFMPQAWTLTLNQFPGRTPALGPQISRNSEDYVKWAQFEVPKPPLQSIISFYYYDTNYNQYSMTQVGPPPLPPPLATVGNFVLLTDPEPGIIQLPFAGIWPTTVLTPGSNVALSYNCGWPAYSGTVKVNASGMCTIDGSPPNGFFGQQMVGTWITLSDPSTNGLVGSYNVAGWIDQYNIQLQVQNPSPLLFPSPDVYAFTGNAVPMPIRQANLLIAAHMYENREPVVTGRSETAIEVPVMFDAMLSPWTIYLS